MMTSPTIVVGTGLAGLTTSLQLLNRGIPVILIEKAAKFGGNSAKASSGINGVPTKFQVPSKDTVKAFINDTIKSGKGLSKVELVNLLAENSNNAIEWLTKSKDSGGIGIDLSVVSQLGGHSYPRTHRGKGSLPPGISIISALSNQILKYDNSDQLTVYYNSSMVGLIVDKGDVVGIEYKSENKDPEKIYGNSVVIATGGFSADFDGNNSLLSKFSPQLTNLPSTNGVQTTGDGQKISLRDVNASLIHMDKTQIHPTGFINLSNPDSKFKFLCGELLRGIGGILLSPKGKRFVNELDTRDVVSEQVFSHCQCPGNTKGINPETAAVIVVSAEDFSKASTHIGFYMSQKLMFKSNFGELKALLKSLDPSCSDETILETFNNYDSYTQGAKDPLERKNFGNPFQIVNDETQLYYGLVTPVLHFSMGGIEINSDTQVLDQSGKVVNNLYAVGEASGGVHGANRLGGSSLLECVVFGNICAQKIYDKLTK